MIQDRAFENVGGKLSAILPSPQCVKIVTTFYSKHWHFNS